MLKFVKINTLILFLIAFVVSMKKSLINYVDQTTQAVNYYFDVHTVSVKHRFSQVGLVKDTSGNSGVAGGGGLITTIIGVVVAIRVFISIMPATITDAKAVVGDNGSGSGWEDSEKAMWGLISLLMVVFGIFIMLRAMGMRG